MSEEKTGSATYSPEDNKLRLYIGRVPRDEYLKLRAEGWVALHKQREAGGGDFAAVWTLDRRNTALTYADIIEDEDMSPAERAADRAERFGDYRDKRTGEATGHADRYDSGPAAHGYQSEARAARAADRHDRIADRAGDAWSKAEYWQRRTAGVISHAMHKASAGVRMGRIKEIEAAIRKIDKELEDLAETFRRWQKIAAMTDTEKQTKIAQGLSGFPGMYWTKYKHPRHPEAEAVSLYDLLKPDRNDADPITGAEAAALYLARHIDPASEDWTKTRVFEWRRHHELRIAYEWQMIDALGERAATVEMVAGGWIGKHQIRKVNKSNATGRVVSVTLKIPGDRWGNSNEGFHLRAFNIERLEASAYRAPTAEDLASLVETKAEEKAAAPKKEECPLINPTDADAEKLQAILNDLNHNKSHCEKPSKVYRCTFEQYEKISHKVATICETGDEHSTRYGRNLTRCSVFKIRVAHSREYYAAPVVVVLTDKAQKALPWDRLEKIRAGMPSPDKMRSKLPALRELMKDRSYRTRTAEEAALISDAAYVAVRWVDDTCSTPQWTDKGIKALQEYEKANAAPVGTTLELAL